MADNEKNLELTIGADIDPFLEEIALMDEEYQKVVKDIESKKAEVKLKTSLDISAARAVGDKMGEIVARNKELDNLIKLQTAKVQVLKKAWDEVKNNQNASVEEIKNAEKAYAKAAIQLNNLTEKKNRGGLMSNLSILAPDTFRRIEQVRNVIASVGAEVPMIGKMAPALGKVAVGFTAVAGAATAYYNVLKKVSDASTEAANKAAAIGEETYKMKERLSLDESTANRLSAIFSIDGTNADAVLKKLEALGAALQTSNEEGTKAEQALNRYGESLRRSDGSMKNSEEMLTAIAAAWKKAEEAGKGYQVLAETGMGRNSTLIASWDDLIARAGKVEKAVGATTKVFHEMSDRSADLTMADKELAKSSGADAAAVRIKVLEKELENRNKLIRLQKEHQQDLQAYEERVGHITGMLNDLGQAGSEAWIKIKASLGRRIRNSGAERIEVDSAVDRELQQTLEDDRKRAAQKLAKAEEEKQKNEERRNQANASLQKMIWELKASDYDKEIAKIEEIAKEKRKAGADEVAVAEYVATAKAKLDEKENKKVNLDRVRKEAEARIQSARQATEQIQQIWMTETQRRIAEIEKQKEAWIKAGADEVAATQAAEKQKREARMSEAERTLQQNVKMIRAMQKAEAQGQDPYAAGRQYAEKAYMKQNGFKYSDFEGLQRYGVENIQAIVTAMKEGLYGQFAGGSNTVNSNNQTTINIDRPVLTDENLVSQLADKVADKILPLFQQNSLGYKGA